MVSTMDEDASADPLVMWPSRSRHGRALQEIEGFLVYHDMPGLQEIRRNSTRGSVRHARRIVVGVLDALRWKPQHIQRTLDLSASSVSSYRKTTTNLDRKLIIEPLTAHLEELLDD